MCGDITPSLAYLPDVGLDAISYDYKVNNTYARSALGGKVKTIGNIDPLGVLLNGDPDTVHKAVFNTLNEGVDVLAPGCCLPPRMPPENITAMVSAHREFFEGKGIVLA